uniref:Succinate dehydrogenase [ubiquinone] cytochrome b small subunit n=1 Tax=Ditylum brightwellii TaxID=49249 RepID=A0A7S4SBY0_9STRA|mmetsp:Transcript_723/g.890  ORF Transcript_723/g.890 Transcript_723/m.890 type:complete len:156 (+) Transcript_723:202-669(+)
MLRIAQASSSSVVRRHVSNQIRNMSSTAKSSPLQGDAGRLGTQIHHKMTTFLAVATPIYFLAPDDFSDGMMGKAFGSVLVLNISAHSWIGLNYVATDYVPKISKSLMGPARVASAGIGIITLLGLGKIALVGEGGIKGTLKALWTPKTEEEKESS